MEVSNWISILAALIVATGWFVTGYLNRRKDVAQKRLEYRLKMLDSFWEIAHILHKDQTIDNELASKLEKLQISFNVYGNAKEIELMNTFIKTGHREDFSKLAGVIRDSLRLELGF